MLESLFVYGAASANTEEGYRVYLALLSYFIASFSAITALSLARQMRDECVVIRKRICHLAGAFALGTGIWSIHFISSLSYQIHINAEYDTLFAAFSFLISVSLAYEIMEVATRDVLSFLQIIVSAILAGFSICAVHYAGMAAMKFDASQLYIQHMFLFSVLAAFVICAMLLWIIFMVSRYNGKHPYLLRACAGMVMGAGVCVINYMDMAALLLIPNEHSVHIADQDFDKVVLIVAIFVSVILGSSIVFTINNRVRKNKPSAYAYTFPVKLLSLSMFMTLAVVLWMGGNNFYIHYFLIHDVAREQRIAELADEVIYVDSAYSQSVKSTTGDADFDKRYSDAVHSELEKKIAELPDQHLHSIAKDMEVANDHIVELDSQYMGLINQGKIKEAEKLLHGAEYINNSQIHIDQKRELSEKVRKVSHENLLHLENNIYATLLLVTVTVIILFVAWYFVLKNINRWSRELQAAQAESIKAQKLAEKEARTVMLLRSVAATSNQATSIEYAIKTVLRLVAEYMEWPVGLAYIFDSKTNMLRSTGLWFLKDESRFQNFANVTQMATLECDIGLSGCVWENLTPIRITDLSNDKNFKKVSLLSDIGVKSGFAFPVIVHGKVVYVLEFFAHDMVEISHDMQLIMEETANQLSQVIERVRIQDVLNMAKSSAEAASIAKSDFLANMSHELRTPLNSILGMLRLLKDSEINEEQSELIGTAFSSSTNLLEIVNDILDLSKIEANEVELEHIGFDLQYIFHSVLLTLEHIAKEKRVSLLRNYENTDFPYVLGDPTRFGRVLINLVSNAIKYTDNGDVTIMVSFTQQDDRHIELCCEIKDTGIGIPAEKQQAIFEKFVQADTSTTRKYGGTGLGLAITKELVELMGGTIGVESEFGQGSTFWFKIPFETTDKLNTEKSLRKSRSVCGTILPSDARVLVAEDHPLNQLYIKKLLVKFGIGKFVIANNGMEAIKHYNEDRWDIILMDCHMPEMNGYDATIEIRNQEKKDIVDARIPIVAMTANAMVGDREKCLRCGMDDYISKPINIDELKEVLGQWIRFTVTENSIVKEKNMTDNERVDVDLAQLRTFTDGDKDTEREFIHVFIEQSDDNIKELHRSMTVNDSKVWTEVAHMLKGGAGGIGAETLRLLCDKAQHLDPAAADERVSLFEQISLEYGRVKKFLESI